MKKPNYDHFATTYALPNYADFIGEGEDMNVVREVQDVRVFVEYRGDGKWCVRDSSGNNYDKKGNACHERMPSGRTEAFLKLYRFSKEEAFIVAAKALPGIAEERMEIKRIWLRQAEDKQDTASIQYFNRIFFLVEEGLKATKTIILDE